MVVVIVLPLEFEVCLLVVGVTWLSEHVLSSFFFFLLVLSRLYNSTMVTIDLFDNWLYYPSIDNEYLFVAK